VKLSAEARASTRRQEGVAPPRDVVYRSHKKTHTTTASGSTKGNRFHSVEIGPGLAQVLQDQLARRARIPSGDQKNAPLFVMPDRTAKTDRGQQASAVPIGNPQPVDRQTVSREWHKHALQDAGLRDMPRPDAIFDYTHDTRHPAEIVVRLDKIDPREHDLKLLLSSERLVLAPDAISTTACGLSSGTPIITSRS
jgi:hypothetical protein